MGLLSIMDFRVALQSPTRLATGDLELNVQFCGTIVVYTAIHLNSTNDSHN